MSMMGNIEDYFDIYIEKYKDNKDIEADFKELRDSVIDRMES